MTSRYWIADIADFYRDIVFAVRNKVGNVVSVRSTKAVLCSCGLAVYVNLAYSCSFKLEEEFLVRFGFAEFDFPAVNYAALKFIWVAEVTDNNKKPPYEISHGGFVISA